VTKSFSVAEVCASICIFEQSFAGSRALGGSHGIVQEARSEPSGSQRWPSTDPTAMNLYWSLACLDG
jgi:hypothetical protein